MNYVDSNSPEAPNVEIWLNGEKSPAVWVKVDVTKGIGTRIVVNEYNRPVIRNNEYVFEDVTGSFEIRWKT